MSRRPLRHGICDHRIQRAVRIGCKRKSDGPQSMNSVNSVTQLYTFLGPSQGRPGIRMFGVSGRIPYDSQRQRKFPYLGPLSPEKGRECPKGREVGPFAPSVSVCGAATRASCRGRASCGLPRPGRGETKGAELRRPLWFPKLRSLFVCQPGPISCGCAVQTRPSCGGCPGRWGCRCRP